jgi:hypothetical protein
MSCHLRLTLGHIPLRSLIHVCVSQYRWKNAIGQKKAPSDSLAIIGGDTHIRPESRAQVMSTYMNTLSHGQNLNSTSAQSQVHLSLLRSNSLKFQPHHVYL